MTEKRGEAALELLDASLYSFPGQFHAAVPTTLTKRYVAPAQTVPYFAPSDVVDITRVPPKSEPVVKRYVPQQVVYAMYFVIAVYVLYQIVHFATQYWSIHAKILESRMTDELAFEQHCKSAAAMMRDLCKDISSRRTDSPRVLAMQDAMYHVYEHSFISSITQLVMTILHPITSLIPALSYVVVGLLVVFGAGIVLRWYFTQTVYVRT